MKALPRISAKYSIGIVFLLLISCAVAPIATDNPVVGKWTWRHVSGSCTELHTYDAAGYKESWSNQENLRFSYSIQPVESGLYKIDSKVIYSNSKPDCTGTPTPLGATSSFYIQMLKNGSYLTCRSAESLSCDGTATHRK
jgi:hypothetical protein